MSHRPFLEAVTGDGPRAHDHDGTFSPLRPTLVTVVCVTVERRLTSRGELVLRRDGEHYEIISNGVFLMDTRNGESERELVRVALEPCRGPARLLLGGLGVGFSLATALRSPVVAEVTVVEVEPAVVAWHAEGGPLAAFSGGLADPRVTVATADLAAWLGAGTDRYDTVCLDVDNGPEWTVTSDNATLYGDSGLDAIDRRLAPGGVLAVWSAAAAPDFERRLRVRYADVTVHTVPVPRGEPDVIYRARDRRAESAARPREHRPGRSPANGRRSAAGGPGRTP
jgi:spermidine synthase